MTDIYNPDYYRLTPTVETIDVAECLLFNRGNVVKYVVRAGVKNPETDLQDLRKAKWYLEREIARMETVE